MDKNKITAEQIREQFPEQVEKLEVAYAQLAENLNTQNAGKSTFFRKQSVAEGARNATGHALSALKQAVQEEYGPLGAAYTMGAVTRIQGEAAQKAVDEKIPGGSDFAIAAKERVLKIIKGTDASHQK